MHLQSSLKLPHQIHYQLYVKPIRNKCLLVTNKSLTEGGISLRVRLLTLKFPKRITAQHKCQCSTLGYRPISAQIVGHIRKCSLKLPVRELSALPKLFRHLFKPNFSLNIFLQYPTKLTKHITRNNC